MTREPPAPPDFSPGPRDGLEQLREREKKKMGLTLSWVPGKCLQEETESSHCLSGRLTRGLISANLTFLGEHTPTPVSALHFKHAERTGATEELLLISTCVG